MFSVSQSLSLSIFLCKFFPCVSLVANPFLAIVQSKCGYKLSYKPSKNFCHLETPVNGSNILGFALQQPNVITPQNLGKRSVLEGEPLSIWLESSKDKQKDYKEM